MADIVKKVNRAVPPGQRTLEVTEVDAGAGDVLLVTDSLGRPASNLSVEAIDDMSFRLNVYHKVYPASQTPYGMPNLGAGQTIKDDTVAEINLSSGESFEIDDGFSVQDIEFITVSGQFSVFLS